MSDEIVDLVDTLDVIVGTAPRAALRDLEAGFRVVHVLAMDAFGDLIVQRIAGSRQSPFTHGSSVAGHVKSGESYALAAMREFKEELGAPLSRSRRRERLGWTRVLVGSSSVSLSQGPRIRSFPIQAKSPPSRSFQWGP